MTVSRRTVLGGSVALAAATGITTGTSWPAAASSATSASSGSGRLVNLAHLDYLGDTVTPPATPGHSRYGSGPLGVLWTYADRRADGSYARIGGGPYDAATNTYGQGAFNTDDLTRAAVVYLRHFQARGDAHSRAAAYGLLRAVTYLQTVGGPNDGNVVLWMQPDGTLNPSAEPVELPDPSDSGPSYWLARTVWALGEGYAVFRRVDPGFAEFLKTRLELALRALERQVLVRYGQWNVVDGRRVPAWLIVAGADATSEAVLGLSAYVRAGGSPAARRALVRFAEAVGAMSAGDVREWPFRALLPWGESISFWHAWGAQMPTALASAATALGDRSLLIPAVGDTAGFTPLLLTAGGPDNGWLPVPADRTQIAYGVDARLQGLLSVGAAADRPGLRQVAAFVAAWYFGANRAGEAMYDPATGRTYDGISGDGVVNRNSGAESTIHGLLSMLALDESLAGEAQRLGAGAGAGAIQRSGLTVVEAETAQLSGGASVVTPPSAWTGESQWSNGSYVSLPAGATASWSIVSSASESRLVLPVVDLVADRRAGRSTWSSGGRRLGAIDHGSGGAQGVSAAPGALLPVTLSGLLAPGTDKVAVTSSGASVRVDALLLLPLVSSVRLGDATLLVSVDSHPRRVSVDGPAGAVAYAYTSTGALHSRRPLSAGALVVPGGFTVVRG
ncbi:hypothetical protein FB561_3308 [Kribbella amoyensis]|uniref:Uncharacterized protein n=1 Tax=Kribbella amoyensis TaxID=996641 RepID=A0A561BTF6_9ACTN|nr:hypothetical protein [Kribbella amoyensis]TWD82180.1 hypothetical protein FB561_3308 [Kribbella amoyensis]